MNGRSNGQNDAKNLQSLPPNEWIETFDAVVPQSHEETVNQGERIDT